MVRILNSPIDAFLKYAEICDIRYCLSGALVRNKRIDSHRRVVNLKFPEKIAKDGRYKRVSFRLDGVRYDVYEHRAIIALVFGKEVLYSNESVDHINGDSHDNRIENLEVVSSKENYRRAYSEQYSLSYGEENPSAILSEDEVFRIREEYMKSPANKSAKDLFLGHGISHSTYCRIISLKSRWLDGIPDGYIEFYETMEFVIKSKDSRKKKWYKSIGRDTPKDIFYKEVYSKLNTKETIIWEKLE